MTNTNSTLIERRLVSMDVDGITLLDAIEVYNDTDLRRISLYFSSGTQVDNITLPPAVRLMEARHVGGAPILDVETELNGALHLTFNTTPVEILPTAAELGLYADTNAAVSVRNGESAEIILAWLGYHSTHHDMTAAVIFDRAKPDSDKAFIRDLSKGLNKSGFRCSVVIVTADVPFGHPTLPPEAHPYCVAEAPGKALMEIPPPAPWLAPLGVASFYEIMRHRYLDKARAVVCIDVYDLLTVDSAETVFDRAVNAPEGVLSLIGQHCFPWRIRKGAVAQFGDHSCVQFDSKLRKQRWCVAPAKTGPKAIWRMIRVANQSTEPGVSGNFFRFMGLRHPSGSVSKIVPKSSLIENRYLLALAKDTFAFKPSRMPEIKARPVAKGRGRCAIVTTMKNEGPFILEWLAYHRCVGVDDFLVYTNDCTDGTDTLLDLLQTKGLVQHRDNPFRESGLKPQHAALQAAESEDIIKGAKWIMSIDVDEFLNIKAGEGTLDDLFAAVPDANMISMTWRLFGNADVHDYDDAFLLEQFTRCAPEIIRNPHQAWGFKTLFQNNGTFKKLGVHRPKGLNPQLLNHIDWVNGSGKPMPHDTYRTGWRSKIHTYGYDLIALNHYAVRSAESFLVKRDRGRVNHVDRDQGLAYWFRMNNNDETDTSITRMLPRLRAEVDRLLSDPEIAAAHAFSVAAHQDKIVELRATENYSTFFSELTSPRMQKLSRMHAHFGGNVFLSGPQVVTDEILARDPEDEFFFTVDLVEVAH